MPDLICSSEWFSSTIVSTLVTRPLAGFAEERVDGADAGFGVPGNGSVPAEAALQPTAAAVRRARATGQRARKKKCLAGPAGRVFGRHIPRTLATGSVTRLNRQPSSALPQGSQDVV